MIAIVLEVPGLHLGYLGCYGNDWVDTPAIDRLAAEGIVFDRHIADCLDGWPSAWTGRVRFPWLSGADDENNFFADLASSNVAANAVRLTAKQDNEVDFSAQMDAVLDCLQDELAGVGDYRGRLLWVELPSLLPSWRPDDIALQRFFPAGEADVSDDDAGFAPIFSPPGEIDRIDGETQERIQFTYAAVVECLDRGLANIFGNIQEQPWWEEAALVVCSPHGIALGERGEVGEYASLQEALIHLPLIVRLPHNAQAARRIQAVTQPVDLYQTILEWFGDAGQQSHGHRLQALMQGAGDWSREYALTGSKSGAHVQWALSTAEWALYLSTCGDEEIQPPLYRKPEDRWEVNDVRQQFPEDAERLEGFLRELIERIKSDPEFTFPRLVQSDDE